MSSTFLWYCKVVLRFESVGKNPQRCYIVLVILNCNFIANTLYILFYYIDTSVLLENIPLIEFIKTTSETRVVYFP